MVVTCDIEFENSPQGAYFAGQVVNGKVILTSDEVKQVKAITLKIKGFAHTWWTEKDGDDSDTYEDTENYIDTKTTLLAPKPNDETVPIEPGTHAYSFSCHIPTYCPSSFEGHYGHIRYMVCVTLVRAWKMNEQFIKGFTVLSTMDLNTESQLLKEPIHYEMQKVFCCGPFKTDPLQMSIQLPQTGYVPGQEIPITVVVTNETNTKINEICLRLVMMVCLYGTHVSMVHRQHEYITVSKLIGDPVLANMKKKFNYLLPVPATPPTSLNGCRIIQIAYRVEAEAKIKGIKYSNQEIQVPVTIGNMPFTNANHAITQQPLAASGQEETIRGERILSEAQVAELWSADASGSPPTFMEAPPSFMEAPQSSNIKANETKQNHYGEKDFKPKYPVFNIPSPDINDSDGVQVQPPSMDFRRDT